MGRAFTPTRSAIFGSPERAAAADIAGVGLNFVMGLGQDEIEAENRREISNASIALQKEWDGLRTYMNLNAGRPDLWASEFQKRKAAIRQGVLSGARQPAARKQIQLETDEQLSSWSGEISNRVSLQIARNANTDFEAGLKRFLDESRSYDDRTDMYEHLENALTHIEDGHERGMDLAATPEQFDLLKRAATRKIIGDYLVAEATLSGDSKGTAIIEHANTVAHQRGIEGNPFGPDDLEDLKKRFKVKLAQKQALAKEQSDLAIEQWRAEALIKLRNKQLTYTDIDNSPLPTTGDLGRQEFYKLLDAQAKEAAKGAEIVSDKRKEAELEKMALDVSTGAVKKQDFDAAILKARYTDKQIDDTAYDQLSSIAIREHKTYQANALKEAIEFGQTQLVSTTQLEQMAEAYQEDVDPKIMLERFAATRKFEQENLAEYRRDLSQWFESEKAAGREPTDDDIYVQSRKMLVHYRGRKPVFSEEKLSLVKPEDVPLGRTLGLEEIWDDLDLEGKRAALSWLVKGATPEKLIAYYKANKQAK